MELTVELNRYDIAVADLDRAIEQAPDDETRIRRQLFRVELLLKNKQVVEAEAAANGLITQGISHGQLFELGDAFGRAEQTETANRFFELYLKSKNLSRREQCDVAYRQATLYQKGETRWRYLLAADADRTIEQHRFLGNVLSEANEPKDAEILGKLASELEPGPVPSQLRIRQADLTTDKRQSAEIGLVLYRSSRLPESHVNWLVEKLSQSDRHQGIVDIFERLLRKGQKLSKDQLARLAKAYRTLGREMDFRRASTQQNL